MAYKIYKKTNSGIESISLHAEIADRATVADKLGTASKGNSKKPIYLVNGVVNEGNDIIDAVYPIGTIFATTNVTSPASLLGGTWERIKDRFLLAAGDNYTIGGMGGESSHTLNVSEMPTHTHRVWTTDTWSSNAVGLKHSSKAFGVAGVDQSGGTEQWLTNESGDSHQILENTGGGNPHNNMPPYIVVNIWKRIS